MKFLEKLPFTKTFKLFGGKKIWAITILAMADVCAMLLPFYLKNFFPNIFVRFGISEGAYNFVSSLYGYVLLPAYLFGGYLADKISLKLLTVMGLGMIGIVGFWYGSIPLMQASEQSTQIQLAMIFIIWGLATGFIFWSALWKLVSQQANEKQQGTVNGVLGSINGLFGVLIFGFGFGLLNIFESVSLGKWAFPVMCYIFSITAIVICILTIVFVDEKKSTKDFSFHWDDLKTIIASVRVWLVALLILGVYMFQTGLSIFINYLENSLKIATAIVVVLGVLRTYVARFLFSAYAGKLADHWGKYILFITLGLIINSCLITIAIVAPGFDTSINDISAASKLVIQITVSTLFILLGIVCWGLVTNRWAVINELKIPEKNYGLMVAFISLVAFSPDAWFWHISTAVYKKHSINNVTTQTGYQIMLAIILGVSLLAVASGCILLLLKHCDNKKQISSNRVNVKLNS